MKPLRIVRVIFLNYKPPSWFPSGQRSDGIQTLDGSVLDISYYLVVVFEMSDGFRGEKE